MLSSCIKLDTNFQTDWVNPQFNVVYSYRTLIPTDYPAYCHPFCKTNLYHLSSLTMIYLILGFKSFSPNY